MDYQTFVKSLAGDAPPAGLTHALEGLWWDAKGDWEKAHDCAQMRDDTEGMRLHAYLHRKEGDPSNASYWYRRAGAAPANGALEEEWETLVRTYIATHADTRPMR